MPLSDFSGDFPLLCRRLAAAKKAGRTGQAYLLVGDDPGYLEQFAVAWAETAGCESPAESGYACGKCRSCTLFRMGNYPDMTILRPQSKSRQITVDAMRNFEHWVALRGAPGMLKVGIIVEAECMGEESQNAFLKTLEEPPPNTMLLLLTVNARRLLPTIRSRCQLLSLLRNRTTYDIAMAKGLYEAVAPLRRLAGAGLGLKISARILKMLSELHDDAEADADSMRDHRWDDVDDKKIKEQLEAELTARIEAEYVRMRENLLGGLHAWFLQRFLISSGVDTALLPHQELLQYSSDLLAKPPTPEEAEEDIKAVEELLQAIRANVDERLAMEVFCLDISRKRV